MRFDLYESPTNAFGYHSEIYLFVGPADGKLYISSMEVDSSDRAVTLVDVPISLPDDLRQIYSKIGDFLDLQKWRTEHYGSSRCYSPSPRLS